jgi:hypothetical protein
MSFFFGVGFVAAAIVATAIGGIWLGFAFMPGVLGAYGLFLSSGKQLDKIDGAILVDQTATDAVGRYAA